MNGAPGRRSHLLAGTIVAGALARPLLESVCSGSAFLVPVCDARAMLCCAVGLQIGLQSLFNNHCPFTPAKPTNSTRNTACASDHVARREILESQLRET